MLAQQMQLANAMMPGAPLQPVVRAFIASRPRVPRGAAAVSTGCAYGLENPRVSETRREIKQGKKLPCMSLYCVFSLA